MFQDKKRLGAGDSPLSPSPAARASKAKAEGAGRRVRGAAGAYLLPEVDGYVGDAQGHQEPDRSVTFDINIVIFSGCHELQLYDSEFNW